MFRNQLNCCKYKSLSSSCSTEHRAKHCERQAEHATQPWTTAWETHTPATSKSETLNSKRTRIERVWKREKRHTNTRCLKQPQRSGLKWMKNSERCMSACMHSQCLMFASCIPFAMVWTLTVHMTSVWLRQKRRKKCWVVFKFNLTRN